MCCVLCWIFWGVVCCVCSHCVVECADLVPGLKHTHQHIHLHTFQFTHFIFSPFSQITFPFPTQKTPADLSMNLKKGEWEKCVELLEVRREGGHVCGVGI